MPTPMTFVAGRSAVNAPVGTDPAALPGLVAMAQGIGDRSEWNKTDLIVAGLSNIPALGDYPSATSFTTFSRSAISAEITLPVAVGDYVELYANGSMQPQAVDSAYAIRIYDGSAAVCATMMNKGAAWTSGEILPWAIQGLYVATVAGSVTFSLQGHRGSTVMTVTEGTSGKLTFGYKHTQKGAA